MTQPTPEAWDGEGPDPWMPQRLQAQAQVAVGERTIYDDYYARLAAWLTFAGQAVLTGVVPNPDAILNAAPRWVQSMTDFVHSSIAEMVGKAYVRIFGPGYVYDNRPFVVDYLARAQNRLVDVPEQAYTLVISQIAEGAMAGESIPKIADRVRESFDVTATPYWRSRPTVVARSEVVSALNAGRQGAFQEVAFDLGEPFEKMWLCVRGDTPVTALGVTHAARRHYEGPLVSVATASGRRVSLTPQHRILTGRGWLPAKDLNKRDHLFQICGVDTPGAPDVDRRPPPIGEVVDAAMASESVEVRTVVRRVNLDGDMIDCYVEVVDADRDLAQCVQPGPEERVRDVFLASADDLAHSLVLCDRTRNHCGYRLLPPGQLDPEGCISGNPALYGFQVAPSDLRSSYALSAASIAGSPTLPQDSGDRGGGASINAGECDNGVTPFHVSGDDLPFWKVGPATGCDGLDLGAPCLGDHCGARKDPARGFGGAEQFPARPQPPADGLGTAAEDCGDFAWRLSSLVAPDHIVDIQVDQFSGHVYDLSTLGGWFAADDLVIHNSTIDSRTRPTHGEADGQRVPLDRPFIVGGFPGMFPGAPELPANESIQCRCTTLVLRPGEGIDLSNRQFKDL